MVGVVFIMYQLLFVLAGTNTLEEFGIVLAAGNSYRSTILSPGPPRFDEMSVKFTLTRQQITPESSNFVIFPKREGTA